VNTISKSLFLSLALSLSLTSVVPIYAAMEDDAKFSEKDFERLLLTKQKESKAELFDKAVVAGDFEVARGLIEAGRKSDWELYTNVIMEHLQRGEALFDQSRMQVQLMELLFDKCMEWGGRDDSGRLYRYYDPVDWFIREYIDGNENRLAISELALARILERHKHGIDYSDYERLMKKLISRHVTIYDNTQIPGFSGKHQGQALNLVDPFYGGFVADGKTGWVNGEQCSPEAFLSEQRLIKRAKERPVNLDRLRKQCLPSQAGEPCSSEDAYNRVLHSYLAPDPLLNDIAKLVEEYHDYVVDAGEPVPYDAERSEDGGQAPEHG
jgi:hypothetical protein